ncbi:MAG: patatin-like phospholipase family protein [Spirochaetaceae bacterium]|nr:patatin-like phospholipase family protein [Spirochaetaceae bacterium]
MARKKSGRVLGLALGGGGARGMAHIGILKALEEADIHFDVVTGTSVGSLVGALTAAGRSTAEIEDAAREIEWSDLVGITVPKLGLVKSKKLEETLERFIGREDIQSLKMPYAAVATDIATAEEVVFTDGLVAKAVRASCSVPVVFEPVIVRDRLLVDGGLVNEVPGDVARQLGADVVISVDLNADRKRNTPPNNLIDVLFYSLNILVAGTSQAGRTSADIRLEPDLQGFGYADLDRIDEAIARGERVVEEHLQEIRAFLE